MKKELKEINDQTVIHCKTQEEADTVTKLAEEYEYTWVNGQKYSEGNKWDFRKENTVYYLTEGVLHHIDYVRSLPDCFKIISAEEFLKANL